MNEPAGRASWKASFPDQLLITTAERNYPFKITPPEGRPTAAILHGTGWHLYPGTELHEVHPGQFTGPVFPLPAQRASSGR